MHTDKRIDACAEMCAAMRVGTCADMFGGSVREGLRMDACIALCAGMCVGMCIDMLVDNSECRFSSNRVSSSLI